MPSLPQPDSHPAVSRRQALKLGGAAVTLAAGVKPFVAARDSRFRRQDAPVESALQPSIRPRRDWAGDLEFGQLTPETDVRFLLVHHTASSNDYGPDDVAATIRGFHSFHTGPEKGWPDVAYNFFVDRFGTIWEARAGSIDSAVRGDATGGSQGFALLAALIGDHSVEPISDAAFASLTQLLAWLAERHGIDTTPGSTVDFVSRGSSRWPSGAAVKARTISGHREMSATQCPGDLAFATLDQELPAAVTALRSQIRSEIGNTQTPPISDTTTPETSTTSNLSASQTNSSSETATVATDQTDASTSEASAPSGASQASERPWMPFAFGGAIVTALGAFGAAVIKRRTQPPRPST